jgi:CRISPR-associated protein Cas1
MKKYLNTLFITSQGAYLNKEGETVVVSIDHQVKLQVPIHTLGGIVCFGQVSLSPYLMGFCAENNVGISFLSEYGRFLARVQGKVSGNVLLRREQYRKADDIAFSADIARSIIMGKVFNARTVMRRALSDHEHKVDVMKLEKAISETDNCLKQLQQEHVLDSVRGIEGIAANTYFEVFDQLILAQKNYFHFDQRNRRPPLDEVNCLLSFVYTLLMHDVRSALEGVGLDPCVGFLHRDRPGRASLALDMMEEFRPFIADRLVLSLINREQIDSKGFNKSTSGAVLMNDDTRKAVITAYQKRKQEEIMHPFIKENVEIGLLFHIQALLLARFLRGDLDGYPVFFWK